MSEVTDMLNNHIYPNLDIRTALSKLEPTERGNLFELVCPACGEKEAFVYKNGITIECNRKNNCGYKKTIWDYIQTSQGLSKQETLKELARLANYTLPQGQNKQIDSKNLGENQRERSLLETSLGFFQEVLFHPEGKETLCYLTDKRGYTLDEIKKLGLGYYPGMGKTGGYLLTQEFSREEIEAVFKYGNSRDEHTLVFPFRNESKRIITFIGRLIRPLNEGEKQSGKYLNLCPYERICLFNSDRVENWNEITLVEGYLDALTATAKGVKNVLATGSASLENKQFESLLRHKVKHVSLCLDMDTAGQKGIEKAINMLTGKGIDSYIISLPKGIKDPDELIMKHGGEAFKEAIESAKDCWKWKAERLISKHDISTDIGKNRCLEEGLAFLNGLPSTTALKHGENFIQQFSNNLGYSAVSIRAEWDTIQERKAREQERKAIERFHQQGAELLRQGKLTEARAHLQQVTELREKALRENMTPYTYETLLKEAKRTPPGLRTGYKEMDKVITIPNEAITIIAGRTSNGKTTFMMNLLLNMLELYPDKAFFFFSYEETRQQIGFKLINILSEEILNEEKNFIKLREYCLSESTRFKEIEAGKAKFREYTENGRLWIIEENYRAEDFMNVLSHLKKQNEIGAVFIDYIQKIKAKGKFGTRQLEIQEVSSQILEAAKSLSLPIILGAQLGRDKDNKNTKRKIRLDNLREAGDIEQDANLVLGIHNEAMENSIEKQEPCTDKVVNLEVFVLKNRNGSVNNKFDFKFNRPVLTIKEKPEERKEKRG